MKEIKIKNRIIGENKPVYVIAEMSANHSGSLQYALDIVHAAKEAKADCIKIQTYTPDTITLNCKNKYFQVRGGLWDSYDLYSLYSEAYMPWDWQGRIKEEADKIGIDFFSTPFDFTAVDFLEELGVEFYKIASFELVDIPLIKYVAEKGKPIIISTGMSTKEEINEAVNTVYKTNNKNIALLKCSSAYPAKASDMNLLTIKDLQESFNVVCGLSDHSVSSLSSIIAVSMGAKIIEKHFCLSRELKSPDSAFSLDVNQFSNFVKEIRETEQAIGRVQFGPTDEEKANIRFRKSIFVVKDIKKGEQLTSENIKIIRPADGLHPRHYFEIIGKQVNADIAAGTPFLEEMISKN